jgi:hypothetical protein
MIARSHFYIELSIASSWYKGEPNTETENDQMCFFWCERWYAIDKSDKLGGVQVESIEVDYFRGIKSRDIDLGHKVLRMVVVTFKIQNE